MRKDSLSERDCDAHLEAYLVISTLHAPLTQEINTSNSRAVIRYPEHQRMTWSFLVTTVVRTKRCIGKWLRFVFGFITR